MKLTTKDLMAVLRSNDDDAVKKTGHMQCLDSDISSSPRMPRRMISREPPLSERRQETAHWRR